MPDGTLDSREESILDVITKWMAVNAGAIYSTRPWMQFGEGQEPNTRDVVNFGDQEALDREPYPVHDPQRQALRILPGLPIGIEVCALGAAAGGCGRVRYPTSACSVPRRRSSGLSGRSAAGPRPAHQPSDFAITFQVLTLRAGCPGLPFSFTEAL